MCERQEEAQAALTEWLAEERHLGREPFRIEYTAPMVCGSRQYYMFRFQKRWFGPWMLGVAGGCEPQDEARRMQAISRMEPYRPASARQDAASLVEQLEQEQQRQTHEQWMRQCLRTNTAYLRQTELPAEVLQRQFSGQDGYRVVPVGQLDFPTGRVLAADPLAYLPTPQDAPPLEASIPTGRYPVEASVYDSPVLGLRVCALRLKLRPAPAVRYEGAAIATAGAGVPWTYFPVDTGLIALCDVRTAREYRNFLDEWHTGHPGENVYDDYFAALFAESCREHPDCQREGGDFIVWKTRRGHTLVMVSTGLGNGLYQSFFGLDAAGERCELVLPLLNPELFRQEAPEAKGEP